MIIIFRKFKWQASGFIKSVRETYLSYGVCSAKRPRLHPLRDPPRNRQHPRNTRRNLRHQRADHRRRCHRPVDSRRPGNELRDRRTVPVVQTLHSCQHGVQALRVHIVERVVSYIPKPIPPTRQPDRVRLDIPPSRRIVVPVQVVRQPRLFIKHLPRIPQVELHRLRIAGAADRLAVWP